MAQNNNNTRTQTVRFQGNVVQIQTVIVQGTEYLLLKDVQRRFPSVSILCIDDVQQVFVHDENGHALEPLRVEARVGQIIEAQEPIGQPNDTFDVVLNRLEIKTDLILANTQAILQQIANLMRQMYELHEYTTPRYFFILPVKGFETKLTNKMHSWFCRQYKLYFLCECSHDPRKMHVAPHDGYSITKPREFVVKYGAYVRTTLNIIKLLLTVQGLPSIPLIENVSTNLNQILPSAEFCESLKEKLETVDTLIDKFHNTLTNVGSSLLELEKARELPLKGAELREVETYLDLVDDKRSLGNLYRIVTTDGHVRWVCHEHYDDISFNNEMHKYINQLEAMGGQFNEKSKEAVVNKVDLTDKNVKILYEALTKGFNIVKIVFHDCTFYRKDLDMLLDVAMNRSSIRCLNMIMVRVYSRLGIVKYICEHMTTEFYNQSLKIRFLNNYQDGNISMLNRFLLQNKIYRKLDLCACDYLGHEHDLQRYLEPNGKITELIVNYCNNIDILNVLFSFKTITLHRIKLNNSLRVPPTASHFCEMLKKNETLFEIDIMDQTGFEDEAFIVDLLTTLKEHKSIKRLSLHVCGVQPSKRKEDCLIHSLRNYTFISRLAISQSVISCEFTQALIYASREYGTLIHLEFYNNQVNNDDMSKLQSLKNDGLIQLTFSALPYWLLLSGKTNEPPDKGKDLNKSNFISNTSNQFSLG